MKNRVFGQEQFIVEPKAYEQEWSIKKHLKGLISEFGFYWTSVQRPDRNK